MNRYLDDGLGADDSARFETHLHECEHCREHLEQLRITIGLMGQPRDADLDPLVLADVMDLYRRWRSDTHRPWSRRT